MTTAVSSWLTEQPISIDIPRVGDDVPIYAEATPELISIHIPRVGDD